MTSTDVAARLAAPGAGQQEGNDLLQTSGGTVPSRRRCALITTITPDGLTPSVWRPSVEAARSVPVTALAPGAVRCTVLGAHPDDETIGAGRLIAGWAARRGPVRIISLTAGEACLDHVGVHLPDLAERRRAELQRAARALGVASTACWDLPDGRVTDHLPDARDRLSELVRGSDVVAAPWRHDPHPDHAALGALAAELCADRGVPLLAYPVWTTYWQQPQVLTETGSTLLVVDAEDGDERCRDLALAAYVSQHRPLAPGLGPVVPAPMLAHHDRQLLLQNGNAR